MKILIFEYATAMGLNDPSITVEGREMLNGILEDLKEYDTYYLIPESHENVVNSSKSIPVTISGNINEWIDRNIEDYDACLPIAPEENNILHDITVIIEDHGVKLLGSSSKAVQLTTNKFDMYNYLKDDFPVVKTDQVFFDGSRSEQQVTKRMAAFFNGNAKILKPADGVSCLGVRVLDSVTEFKNIYNAMAEYTLLPYFIIQDYVPGWSVSVSLLTDGATALPISLNYQNIELKNGKICYGGGTVPFDHRLDNVAKETAKNAVESIEGLKGYVGVDMIIDDENDRVHLIEINSRLTTPYVALRGIINFNMGKAIIDAVYGKLPSTVALDGSVKFYKEDSSLRLEVLK